MVDLPTPCMHNHVGILVFVSEEILVVEEFVVVGHE